MGYNYWVFIVLFLFVKLVSLEVRDILYPYPDGFHSNTRRTHRHARDCMANYNSTETFENIKASKLENQIDLHRFRIRNSKNQVVYGHRVVIKNPKKLVSVLEPSHPGGCKSRTLSKVADTAQIGKCHIAANAGFFQPFPKKEKFGECYGNIVSNGRYVQDSRGIQNANFGIRQDGTLVIGYLSEIDVISKHNPFLQLVSGVGWVLKNGTLFVEGSKRIECLDTQTTGADRFFNVHSARVLIGYDKNGYVYLFQFDGKTNQGGVNLAEAGEYMKSLGVINAINLDGGGSATFVVDGAVANYPSDGCGHGNDICERNVSTIICIKHPHELRTEGKAITGDENISDSADVPSSNSNSVYIAIIVVLSVLLLVAILVIIIKIFFRSSYFSSRQKTSQDAFVSEFDIM